MLTLVIVVSAIGLAVATSRGRRTSPAARLDRRLERASTAISDVLR